MEKQRGLKHRKQLPKVENLFLKNDVDVFRQSKAIYNSYKEFCTMSNK